MVLERLGEVQGAVAEFRLALEYSDDSSLAKAHVAYGLARLGDRAGATEILNTLLIFGRRVTSAPIGLP